MPTNVEDLMRVEVRYRHHNQRCLNTFWYIYTPGVPFIEDNEVDSSIEFLDAFDDAISAEFLACQSAEANGHSARAQIIGPRTPPGLTRFTFQEQAFGGSVGTGGAESLPSGNAAVLRRRTALAGHANRGRIYLAGIPLLFEENSLLNEDGVDALSNLAVALGPPVVGPIHSWTQVLVTQPLLERRIVVTSHQADDVIRYQRRREVGVGE